uniref:Uncharacterized protein n=1 Tax=Arundo donax TaxID=35708 RepID=A0A0A9ACL4_ARUDO
MCCYAVAVCYTHGKLSLFLCEFIDSKISSLGPFVNSMCLTFLFSYNLVVALQM